MDLEFEWSDVSLMSDKSLQSSPTLCDSMDCSPQALCPWDSPGKNAGVSYHFLLQGIFPTQGLNLRLLSPELAGRFFTTEPPGNTMVLLYRRIRISMNCHPYGRKGRRTKEPLDESERRE